MNLVFFGVLNEKIYEVLGVLEIFGLFSFLVDNSFNIKVKGLNEFFKNELFFMIVYYFFDLMVLMGIFCFIILGLYMLFLIVKKLCKYVISNMMLYVILLIGFVLMLVIEFGWFLIEMGC